MRTFLALLLLIITTYNRKENIITSIKFLKETKTQKDDGFKKINTSQRFSYFLPKKIIPDKEYDYWQYAKYFPGKKSPNYVIITESGDTSLKEMISKKHEADDFNAVKTGGHPTFSSVYIITIKNNKLSYIKSNVAFRAFLGKIDNLEEALLLAETFGYTPYSESLPKNKNKGCEYRKVKDGFELHLTGYDSFRSRLEFVELKITREGFIKTKNIGFESLRP